MTRTIDQAGFDMVKSFEGLRLTAYLDVAGIWTVGYGHTGADVAPDTLWTQVQADDALRSDLATAEAAVERLTVRDNPSNNEFSAMTSLVYNIGVGAFSTSSVLRFHISGNTGAAAASFLLWDKAHVDGVLVTVPGLLRRRKAEMALYLTTDA